MSIRAVAAAAVLALGLVTQAAAQDGAWRDFMPPTRRGATLVHDTTRDRYVMFGGDDTGLRNEVWTLPGDSTAWRDRDCVPARTPATNARFIWQMISGRAWAT